MKNNIRRTLSSEPHVYETEDGLKIHTRIINSDDNHIWVDFDNVMLLLGIDEKTFYSELRSMEKSLEFFPNRDIRKLFSDKDGLIPHVEFRTVIMMGHRVRSERSKLFQRWAWWVLGHYIHKGFAINERLIKSSISRKNELYMTTRKLMGNGYNEMLKALEEQYSSPEEIKRIATRISVVICESVMGVTPSEWMRLNPECKGQWRQFASPMEAALASQLEFAAVDLISSGNTKEEIMSKIRELAIIQLEQIAQVDRIAKLRDRYYSIKKSSDLSRDERDEFRNFQEMELCLENPYNTQNNVGTTFLM